MKICKRGHVDKYTKSNCRECFRVISGIRLNLLKIEQRRTELYNFLLYRGLDDYFIEWEYSDPIIEKLYKKAEKYI